MEYINAVDFKESQESETIKNLIKGHNTIVTKYPEDFEEEKIECVIKLLTEKIYIVVLKESLYDAFSAKIIEENAKHKNV